MSPNENTSSQSDTQTAAKPAQVFALWRFILLGLILALLAWALFDLPEAMSSERPRRYAPLLSALLGLLNIITSHFIRSPKLQKAAFGITIAWLVFVGMYLFTNGFTRSF